MYLSIIYLPIPIDLSICISLRVYLLDLSSTSLVCYDSIDGFSVVVILGEEVLGKRALCTYVHRHTHTHTQECESHSQIHKASYSTAHESILTTTNIRRECPGVHNNAAFKPVHVGLQEILDHCEAPILVTTSAKSFNADCITRVWFLGRIALV